MLTLGAFAIILDAGPRVLLSHRTDRDAWNLPGGRVESKETPWEAVVREVRRKLVSWFKFEPWRAAICALRVRQTSIAGFARRTFRSIRFTAMRSASRTLTRTGARSFFVFRPDNSQEGSPWFGQ
ncbi:MAG: NUDIX hydrolase [Vicinamibacterales bacterium]